MSDVCVVHLVWEPLGTKPFGEFIESYRRHKSGLDHHLLILFNGFREERESSKYHELLDGLAYSSLFISPSALDIPAYFHAAQNVDYKYLCFLNSYSRILDENWLAKMHQYITDEKVGIVGATGSYMSHYSASANTLYVESGSLLKDVLQPFYKRIVVNRNKLYFPSFPNPHLRTNGFLINRELMLSVRRGAMRRKMDVYKFESGKNSFTRQILAMNLKALVVGRNGRAYDQEEWFESGTLWTGDQPNLLISDNRTKEYMEADRRLRRMWAGLAWGGKADITNGPPC